MVGILKSKGVSVQGIDEAKEIIPDNDAGVKISRRIFGVLLLLALEGCRKDEQPKVLQPRILEKPLSHEELEARRENVMKEWFEAAHQIVLQTQDKEAEKIYRFVSDNAALAEPHEKGAKILRTAESGNSQFFLVPILPDDKKMKGKLWKKYTAENAVAANFIPDVRMLILKSHIPTSSLWRGLIVIHEGNHALIESQGGYPDPEGNEERAYCYEERDTHALQNRLMSKMGGPEYEALLREEVERQRKAVLEKGLEPGKAFMGRSPYNPKLDIIFGKAESEFEKAGRATHVWIHGVFQFIEQFSKGDIEEQKALFLRKVYLEEKIFQ